MYKIELIVDLLLSYYVFVLELQQNDTVNMTENT